jgi:hypothetical protein
MRKYRTKDGRDAEILRTGIKNTYPVVVLLTDQNGTQHVRNYTSQLNFAQFGRSNADLVEVPLNFKKWLKEQGVDTKLFWRNCKRKNQGWDIADSRFYIKRKNIGKLYPPHWLSRSFDYQRALSEDSIYWSDLSSEWDDVIESTDGEIVFGFGKENKE